MSNTPAEAICAFVPPFLKYLREGTAKVDLSPARFQLLQALDQHQPCSMVELADLLSVTKRNITTLIDALEQEGLVERQPHPTDRRSKLVSLTETGQTTFRQAVKVQQKHLETLVSNLEPQHQELMAQALDVLTKTLKSNRCG